ncbi:hypothetical protein BC829DRAFT_447849 [Chytridium lagenaria]|nr:hypothetical protein BC829DRAFT_447849 [Chytridium lagenaria]
MSSEPIKDEVVAPEVEDNTFKVFAGNLAFSITEDDLKEAFSKAGPVLSSNIIVRNSRSLGYGFVSFSTETEAKKAVELLDKVELAGRQLNVEFAKPKAAGEQKAPTPRRRGRKGNNAAPAADGVAPAEGESRPKRRGGREARIDQDGEQPEGQEGDAPKRPPVLVVPTTEGATEGAAAPLPARGAQEGEDYKVTSAKVVSLRNGRSKGFGFVEVESEEEQARVISELQNIQVDGRDLIIKVALQSSHNVPGEEATEEQ